MGRRVCWRDKPSGDLDTEDSRHLLSLSPRAKQTSSDSEVRGRPTEQLNLSYFFCICILKMQRFPSCWASAKRIPVYLVSTGRPARASCFSAAGVSAGTRLTSDLCMCVCVSCSLQLRVPVVSLESFHTGLLYSLLFCHTLFFSLCFFFFFTSSCHEKKKKIQNSEFCHIGS